MRFVPTSTLRNAAALRNVAIVNSADLLDVAKELDWRRDLTTKLLGIVGGSDGATVRRFVAEVLGEIDEAGES